MSKENLRELHLEPLILASASPRRAEILRSVGWQFEKLTSNVDETELPGEAVAVYVERLARAKAEAVAANIESGLILGADTTVYLDDEIIGKPTDYDDAGQMLRRLSGRWHTVLSGVALIRKNNGETVIKSAVQQTEVKFNELSAAEVDLLIETGEPLDKAGAYAVQGVAALFISEIRGDYWNVVGLPINLVYTLYKQIVGVE